MKRLVVIKCQDSIGVWSETFTVSSAQTAIDEVQSVLDDFNKGKDEKSQRYIVELVNISIDLCYQNLSKDEIKSLKLIKKEYVDLDNSLHQFRKKNLVSNIDGSDTYECENCRLTGTRLGLASHGVSVKAPAGQIRYCQDYLEFIKQAGVK